MSVSDKEISSVGISGGGDGGCGGCGGDNGNEDDDESGGGVCGVHANEDRRTKQSGYGCGGFRRNLGKVKQVVLNPFTKARNRLPIRKQTRAFLPSSSSSAPNVVASSGKGIGGGGSSGKGCYFCFTRPLTLESPIGFRTSDPNDPNFTFDMLNVLIEQSDFYSRECNPHLDIHSD